MPVVALDRMAGNVLLHEGRRFSRERRRRRPSAARVEPEDDIAAVPGESDRRPCLERQRRDVATLTPHEIRERRHLNPASAVAGSGQARVIDFLFLRIVGALGQLPRFSIEPRIEEHSMLIWKRSGSDRRVSGAGDGIQVGIRRALEPRALVDQSSQSASELSCVALEVIHAHLIDNENDDEFRFPARLRRSVERQVQGCHANACQNRGQTQSDAQRHLTASTSESSTGPRCKHRTQRSRSNTTAALPHQEAATLAGAPRRESHARRTRARGW